MSFTDIFRTFIPVKETVADISKVMRDMAAEMQSMRETINRLYADIARLTVTRRA